ncbi:MAG: phosphatidylglycerol lysyltransferase domain-containing protein [Methanocella sp.]
MLSLNDFRPVRLEDRDFFAALYAKYPQVHSDNTFTNMACWNHYAHYSYAQVNDSVIIASTIEGITRFRPPIGPRDPALMADLIKLGDEVSDCTPMVLIDGPTAEWMQASFGPADIVPDRDHFEYVYRTRDLAELPNGLFHSTRRQLNKFKKSFAYTVEPISAGNSREVNEFLDQWCEWKLCEGDEVLENEKDAVMFAIDHFDALKLSGLLIRVEGKIGAMSIFEPLNTDTALVHFEKGLDGYEGIYKAINAETAAVLAGNFEYVNRESDMGVAGLREAKTRYHPHHMVEVYTLRHQCIGEMCSDVRACSLSGTRVTTRW